MSSEGLDDLGGDFASGYDFPPSYGGGNSPAKAEPNQNQVSYGGHAEYVKYEPYPQQNQNYQNQFGKFFMITVFPNTSISPSFRPKIAQ